MDIYKINLKNYHNDNNEFINNHKISKYTKTKVLFSLVHRISNRAFHAENLSKLDKYNKPVIWSRFGQGILDSQHIEGFMRDTLELFGIDIKVGWGTQKSPKAVE